MLGLMLQAHPRIAIPLEKHFLVPAYLERENFGDLGYAENRRLLAAKIVGSANFEELALDPGWITDRIVDQGWTVGAAVGLVLRAHADRFGKVRWGDKRPYYRRYIWVIERLFPNAQFVGTIRDGRDCVASMASLPAWKSDSNPNRRIREWMEAVQNAEMARERLPPERFYGICYEKLVTEPEKQLRGLCEFLGEEFDEAMLTPQDVSDQVVPERQFWHAKTREEVSAGSIGRFAERLTDSELQVCETIMGDRLRELGYELSGLPRATDEQVESYARHDAKREREVRNEKATDQNIAYPWPVADMPVSEAQLHRTVAELQGRVAMLTKQRDAARERRDRVLGSRTWRWTEPLRAARRTVGRPL